MAEKLPRRVIVTTVPFGERDRLPLDLLREAGVELTINPINRRLKPSEVGDVIAGFPVVIAGTETIDRETMRRTSGLKAICRVGIGLDSVDLTAARELGIAVSYTPEAPSPAVAELTVGLIVDLLRGVHLADRAMREGRWIRHLGARISEATVGVIGTGRIGGRVIRHLQGGFPGVRILASDPARKGSLQGVTWTDLDTVLRKSDVVTLHVPLKADTIGLISACELRKMKPHAVLVNTSRGGIVNEADLDEALHKRVIQSAAIDVFQEEPYAGPLTKNPNILLTCHMGSMTADCRATMEIEATREAIRFLNGEPLQSAVPDDEYEVAKRLDRN